MLKITRYKLLLFLATSTIIGVVSIKSVSSFYNVSTEIKKLQDSNKKETKETDLVDYYQNEDQEKKESSLDTKAMIETPTYSSKQETINSIIPKSNNNTSENTTVAPKTEDNPTETKASVIPQPKTEIETTEPEPKAEDSVIATPQIPTFYYDRTTRIYDDDRITLIRVEYYVNNKLTYYSEIEQFDATTKSYIERIYLCNLETNIDPLIRTDIYVNGILTNSY